MTTIEVTWSMKPTLIPCSISGRNDSSSASMSSSVRLWANPISTVSPGRATAASSIFGSLTGGPPVGVDRELEAVLVYVFDLAVPDQEIFRSEEHTSELHSLMRISYAVFCLKKHK